MTGFGRLRADNNTKAQREKSQAKEVLKKAHNEYKNGRLKTTKALLEQIIKTNPENSYALGFLASTEKALGNKGAAIKLFEQSIKINKDNPDILHNYAGLLKKDDPDKAIRMSDRAVAISPDNFNYLERNGFLKWKKGDLENALNATIKAVKLNPYAINAHMNLSGIYKELGDLDQALSSTIKSLEIKPDNADALINLSGIYKGLGNLDLALSSILKSLEIKPDEPIALTNLGSIYQELGNFEKALAPTIKSLNLKTDNPNAYINLGLIHNGLGNLEQAHTYAQKSLELQPNSSKTLYLIGKIRMAEGNVKEAKKALLDAIDSNPSESAAYYELSVMISTTEEAVELLKIAKSIEMKKLDPKNKMFAQFTLSNCFHTIEDFKSASQHLKIANEYKLSVHPSNVNQLKNLIEKNFTQKTYTSKVQINTQCGKGRIFIVGMPRSGSTLLETILSTNPDIQDLGEVRSLAKAIRNFQEHTKNNLNKPNLCELYSQQIPLRSNKLKYTVDKNLYNFIYTGWIIHHMPSAKIIHCRRHPMDNILSMYRSNLLAGNNYTSNLQDTARILIMQEILMQNYKEIHPQSIFSFDYDEFVREPKTQLLKLLEWLNLEYNESYLHPENSKRIVSTASVMQVRKPISNKSVGGWKNYKKLLKPAQNILDAAGIFKTNLK
ncbi:tetratricopeptide repeat-containing sulfotransferase family protein [Synechococcus sp. UW179A]|uniref:tetratricopeptide repeat-containing sulfotransferase family protein n=1 Tax=Synechococcus sp. UW179A TaxID=2575510 RepID=UPI000E0E2A03|nr:tetratricopeptide repeat-containing sulfotransferase family protein [Synechococcus sp. UW179A]